MFLGRIIRSLRSNILLWTGELNYNILIQPQIYFDDIYDIHKYMAEGKLYLKRTDTIKNYCNGKVKIDQKCTQSDETCTLELENEKETSCNCI